MKHHRQTALFLGTVIGVLLFCSSCKDCLIPPCAPPDLNESHELYLEFCTSGAAAACYDPAELSPIGFRIRLDELVVLDTLFNDFAAMEHSVKIGTGSAFKFGPEGGIVDQVAYHYEFTLPSSGTTISIGDFQFAPEDPCSCPAYRFESALVNEIEVAIADNRLILNKL